MMKNTMKNTLLLLIISLLSACSITNAEHEDIRPEHNTSKDPVPAPALVEIRAPDPTIVLLSKRQIWCVLPEAERSKIDTELSTRNNSTRLFQRLILSTCAPEKNAAQSRILIATLYSLPISEAERALLTLIDHANRSLLKVQQERDTLRSKLRHTIDGISDIETQINGDASSKPEVNHE